MNYTKFNDLKQGLILYIYAFVFIIINEGDIKN